MIKMNPEISESKIYECKFGVNVKIVKPVNLYNCKIGNNCKIGPFTEIQKNVLIQNKVLTIPECFTTIGEKAFDGETTFYIDGRQQELILIQSE